MKLASPRDPYATGDSTSNPDVYNTIRGIIEDAKAHTMRPSRGTHAHAFETEKNVKVWRGLARNWATERRLNPPRARLPAAMEQMVTKWFNMVDLDGGGTLNADEVSKVMIACNMPADKQTVGELIDMIDRDGDHVVSVAEFEWWVREQISRGKPIDEGTFELPSGQTLPLANIVNALTRTSILQDIVKGGKARKKWYHSEGDMALQVIRAKRCLLKAAKQVDGAVETKEHEQKAIKSLMKQDSTLRFLAARKLNGAFEAQGPVDLKKRKRAFKQMLRGCRKNIQEQLHRTPSRSSTPTSKLASIAENDDIISVQATSLRIPTAQLSPSAENSSDMSRYTDYLPPVLKTCGIRSNINSGSQIVLPTTSSDFASDVDKLQLGCTSTSYSTSSEIQRGMEKHRLRTMPALSCSSAENQFRLPSLSETTAGEVLTAADSGKIVVEAAKVGGRLERNVSLLPEVLRQRESMKAHVFYTAASSKRGEVADSLIRAATSLSGTESINSVVYDQGLQGSGCGKVALDLTYKMNRPFQIKHTGHSGEEWTKVMSHDQGRLSSQKEKLRGGGLCATPLLPSICMEDHIRQTRVNAVRPLAMHASPKRRCLRAERPKWLVEQAQ